MIILRQRNFNTNSIKPPKLTIPKQKPGITPVVNTATSSSSDMANTVRANNNNQNQQAQQLMKQQANASITNNKINNPSMPVNNNSMPQQL